MRRVVLAFLAAVTITVGAFVVAGALPSVREIAYLLAPGYAIPKWYWGGIGDPLQVLVVLGLNILIYTAFFYFVLSLRERHFRSKQRPGI